MVEVQFPFVLIRTGIGLTLMDRMGETRFSRKMGLISLVVMPFLAAVVVFLVVYAIISILS